MRGAEVGDVTTTKGGENNNQSTPMNSSCERILASEAPSVYVLRV